MTDWTALGIGLGFALLGGMLIALGSRRWSLCPLRECPALEAGQRVEFTVAGKRYATVLTGVDGDALRRRWNAGCLSRSRQEPSPSCA